MSLRVKRSNLYRKKYYFFYVATNYTNTTLYCGVTNNLIKRIYEHKNKLVSSFTSRYNINKLVYYEVFEDIDEAIKREKQVKGGSRQKKLELILKDNPSFKDLYDQIASG